MFSSYVERSFDVHLFSGRIVKEHSLFLKAGFTPANASFAEKAEFFRCRFEKLLCEAVKLADGIVSQKLLCSQEIVTEFTALAEKQTECFTGIPIDNEITCMELRLKSASGKGCERPELRAAVKKLNQTALSLLDGLISFKETILQNVLCGEMFTVNYPLLLEHIIREAKLYRESVERLEKNSCTVNSSKMDTECFWNRIMMEHAMFIRGLLDPCETELFDSADKFADEYCKLLEKCRNLHSPAMTDDSLELTRKFRDFKTAGVQGIEQHKIHSVILPLLADHVLREANPYLRLLKG